MKTTSVLIPQSYIALLDELVDKGKYPSRSEAIRFAIRDLLKRNGMFGAPVSEVLIDKINVASRLLYRDRSLKRRA